MRDLKTELYVIRIIYDDGTVKYVGDSGWTTRLQNAHFYKKRGMMKQKINWINTYNKCCRAEPYTIHLYDYEDA